MIHHTIKTPITVVSANDHFRNAFVLILEGLNKYIVANSYSSGELAIKGIKNDRAELIVLAEVSDMTSDEFVASVKSHNSLIKTIVLDTEFTPEYVYKLFSAGATGLITTDSSYEEKVRSIETALNGGAPMSSSVAKTLVGFFQKNTEHCPLSRRERTVLELQTKGKTYSQISTELSLSKETVKTHIKNIYHKLKVNSKSAAIEKALTERYILSY